MTPKRQRKPKEYALQVFWELQDGTIMTYDDLLSQPQRQAELLDRQGFNRAIRTLKRAGTIQSL